MEQGSSNCSICVIMYFLSHKKLSQTLIEKNRLNSLESTLPQLIYRIDLIVLDIAKYENDSEPYQNVKHNDSEQSYRDKSFPKSRLGACSLRIKDVTSKWPMNRS